ncbi:tRNA 2-thiouridine(34) synthase MnmA [Candidatus Peribacteria bacterium]|nr:tRNA 2-thiouridine(34) synthase MnmA [Candidatus Peribacteria bacterium]
MRIAVGLSGGVDSSVALQLLQQQGHDCTAFYMKNWDEHDPLCPSAVDSADARLVAEKLGVPFYTLDLSSAYRERVFRQFIAYNQRGITPNPDIWCNEYIKFAAFWDAVQALGDYTHIATGHYARVRETPQGHALCTPTDAQKDQTYFLYRLSQKQLSRALFPLAELTKPEVRHLAETTGLLTAEKKDSTGICFIGKRHYRDFIAEHLDTAQILPGPLQDLRTGQAVGTHTGLPYYTLGQRKNLLIGGLSAFRELPWFVVRKDFASNTLLVSQYEEDLLERRVTATELHWIQAPPMVGQRYTAKIRYRSDAVPCTVISLSAEQLVLEFTKPVRSPTPGQAVVLYDGPCVVGGGEIA